MLTNVAFFVPGQPQGKGRARVGRVGAHARMYTPAKTEAYEGLVAQMATAAMGGCPPIEQPCRVEVEIVFAIPASWSKKKRQQALDGQVLPAIKPDADNVIKAVCDGANGIVWRDDVQAVQGMWTKRYGERPGVFVCVAVV